MTQQEKQEIIEAVLEALQTNSQSISQLTPVTELMDSDLFEVAGGKRVTFANIVAALLSSSGYAAATAAEQADMWQVLMQNFVATQENESVGGVQPPLEHWAQSRVVLLKSMGAPFDDVDASTLSVGDLIYSSQGKWILEKLENNLGNGIHPSEGVLYVNLAAFKAYRWDGTSFQDAIKGGSGASSVTAFAQYSVVESTSELPSVGDPTTGYIVGTHIYAYVGEDGDTADGKYQDLGALEAAGVSVTTAEDGTFTIHAGGNDYTVNLNHTHENMAKLIVCEESDLPSTLDNSTIYAITDSGETEIEKLIIRGMEFAGGGYAPGTPRLNSPSPSQISNGIDIGNTTSGVVTYLLNIKARDLTQSLLVQWGSGSTGYSFDTSNLPTGVTYDSGTGKLTITKEAACEINGVNIPVVYTGNDTDEDAEGTIGISSSSVDGINVEVALVANKVTYEDLAGVKLTGTQWLQTDYKPNAKTQFVLNCDFDANSNSDNPSANYHILNCPNNTGDGKKFQMYSGLYANNYQGEYTLFFVNESSLYNGAEQVANMQRLIFGDSTSDKTAFISDGAVISYSFQSGASSGTIQMVAGGVTKSHATSLKGSTMENALAIGVNADKTKIYNVFDLTIHSFIITEDGEEVRHWVPKMKNGTIPGLYDTKNGTFMSSETAKASGLASDELVAIPLT